jgi:iron(III) transport system substrate-binding protein
MSNEIRHVAMLVALAVGLGVSAAAAQAPVDILNYRGPDREQKLIEGARKEGQVVFYSAMIVNQALRPIADRFGKKYPFIKMTYWRADSEDIAQKASAEVRAGNVVGDVLEGTGVGEQAVQAGLLVPYTTPAIAAFPER